MHPIDGKTQLIGLIGWPVSHSFSPAMHNAAARALGLNWVYLPLPVASDRLSAAVSGLAALGFRGANVTVPHKQTVLPLLDRLAPGARAIGAVNTIVVEANGRLTGHNTDWSGFLADLQAHKVPVANRDCLVLGAGGSARAVAYGLAQSQARVYVLARRLTQAMALVEALQTSLPQAHLRSQPLSSLAPVAAALQAPLIINTTPLGMAPDDTSSPWPGGLTFPEKSTLYDLVYNPRRTRLMAQAAAAGCQALGGLGMLVQQGAMAFSLWTGQQPDTTLMQRAIASFSQAEEIG